MTLMRLRWQTVLALAAAVTVVALVAASAGRSDAPDAADRAFDAKCGTFPPASGVAADAPSLPDQRAWNQDISAAPVAANSDQIVDYINSQGGSTLHPDFGRQKRYGIPFRVVGAKAKPTRVRFTAYGDESDKGPYRIPLSAPVEGGPRSDGDRHVITYDKSRCRLYELYRAFPKRKGWNAESGAIWDLSSPGLRTEGWTSADAAGLPIFPGLVRRAEVEAGVIDHAIRITFESTRDAFINPASHCAGDTDSASAPPMGLRLRLKASYDTSGITGEAAVIAAALKRYGVINADNGSNWFISGTADRGWSNGNLNQLKEIPGSAFEVVRSEAGVQTC